MLDRLATRMEWIHRIDHTLADLESQADSPGNRGRIMAMDDLRRLLDQSKTIRAFAIPLAISQLISEWKQKTDKPADYRLAGVEALEALIRTKNLTPKQ